MPELRNNDSYSLLYRDVIFILGYSLLARAALDSALCKKIFHFSLCLLFLSTKSFILCNFNLLKANLTIFCFHEAILTSTIFCFMCSNFLQNGWFRPVRKKTQSLCPSIRQPKPLSRTGFGPFDLRQPEYSLTPDVTLRFDGLFDPFKTHKITDKSRHALIYRPTIEHAWYKPFSRRRLRRPRCLHAGFNNSYGQSMHHIAIFFVFAASSYQTPLRISKNCSSSSKTVDIYMLAIRLFRCSFFCSDVLYRAGACQKRYCLHRAPL